MTDPASRERAALIDTLSRTMRTDAATAEVLGALAGASVEARVLKGPVIRRWLYDDGAPRYYSDSDVLVRPDQVEEAWSVLSALGFERPLDERELPEWWREHDSPCQRHSDGVWVDLHTSLPGVCVEPMMAWHVLTESADEIEVGGYVARTLSTPARALHLALHVTHHGRRPGSPFWDLARGLARCSDDVWRDAATLAQRLGATDSFAAGLRSSDEGAALAARLGLPEVDSIEVTLTANAPPVGALTFEKLLEAKGVGARASIVWRKIVPPAAFMRVWAPATRRGRLALAAAYVRRPFWILRRAPKGLRAYWEARQAVRRRHS